MTNISILEYFGMRNSLLTIDIKNNNDINRKSEMAALNLHNREGNCGILCRSCSCNGMIIIIISYVFWNDLNNFW